MALETFDAAMVAMRPDGRRHRVDHILCYETVSETHWAAAGIEATSGLTGKAPKSLRILILGGTGFTGPHQVRYALSRGHKVTVFNRGKTHPGELPKEAEQLLGDRNGQLEALKGRQWDVCIDNPTTLPVWVRDAAQILKGNIDRYVFISTISVYSDNSKPGMRLPFPVGKKKEPISKEIRDEYESAQLLNVPITPHSTYSGYLFFDVLDAPPEPGAHLYVSGIKAGSQELFYFDIPMDKPDAAAPAK